MAFVLSEYAASCRVADPEGFVTRCGRFFELLTAANSRMNLTRITSRSDFELKHVADSLSMLRCFPALAERKVRLADVGCGAGFPSVVLAAAFPEWSVTAIDSTHKKIAFVDEAARELGLTNLRPVAGRAVELARREDFAECFDVVTARAVATAEKLFRECRRMVVPGGRFIFYKTPGQAEELAALKHERGFVWRGLPESKLPEDAGTRLFLTGVRS